MTTSQWQPLAPQFASDLVTGITARASGGSEVATFTRASTAYVLGYGAATVLGVDSPIHILCDSGEPRFYGSRRISANSWSVTDANGVALIVANGASSTCCDAGGPFGYLAEGARADVLGTTAAIRRTMTDVGWVNTTMTVGTATGTDGVASAAASLTATAGNATTLFTTVLGAAVRTFSAWVRRKTGTGTVNITGDNGVTWTAITLTTTYALFQFTTASAANPVVGFRLVTSGDAIEVDWNTLEAATFANPTPIPLNVSKAADVLTYPTSGNVSETVGSAYAEWQSSSTNVASGESPSSILVNFVTGAQALMYYRYQNNGSVSLYDGTAEVFTSATVALNTETKAATSWGGSVMKAVFGGGTVASGSFDGSMNPGANMAIGSNLDGSGSLYGTVRNVRIYATALSAGQLAAMTST